MSARRPSGELGDVVGLFLAGLVLTAVVLAVTL